ncbi:MAG TPA: GNAT family N-acetyltransferase [Clostridia bacterium]|nr:MAG: hypothetical protein BWX97_00971 [Firmicutes bacterium ADurb.Bin146]HOD93110.1 GNAT family N-acetyltransferase [Clostridia bacterium]HQM39433.1 GNAT family N-acetyltransferase [Clostridia bacterium]
MNITYVNTISANEVNYLRSSIGFRKVNLEQVQASLNGSAYVIAAYNNDEIIGMSRLIWDGGSVALIHDIIVIPQYQMQGIEIEMLNRIFDFLKSKLKPCFGIQVDIRAWNNQTEYFESIGFQVSTPQKRGVPMHICLTNQIELIDIMSE